MPNQDEGWLAFQFIRRVFLQTFRFFLSAQRYPPLVTSRFNTQGDGQRDSSLLREANQSRPSCGADNDPGR